jgi:predicted lysophospholipase L1 biosynthesis ABC-type transport system permease subunit
MLGAVLMPASLFLNWYEVPPGVFRERGFQLKGWDVFESTDAVLTLAAIVVLVLLTQRSDVSRWLTLVGAVAMAFVVNDIVDKPAILGLFDTPGLSLEIGAWVALAGTILVVAAGLLDRGWDASPSGPGSSG